MVAPNTALLQGLNSAQRDAVEHPGGPLLILAGPGSGKTRVIAHRIARLVERNDAQPQQILAVTFTNKAAREMRERVHALVGDQADAMTLGTFHSICARFLRIDGPAIDVPRGFVIYDDADQLTVVRHVLEDLGVDSKRQSVRSVLSAISRAKSEGRSTETVKNSAANYFDEIVARAFERYQVALLANGALDFDDLLTKALRLFTDVPDVMARYQRRYQHVLVDEFQDTNVVQYRLARAWAGATDNLTVVGDPDQSIYSWRSADIRNILNFERDYPDAALVRLEQNYRSTKSILTVADAVIGHATERIHKSLWTENEDGVRPVVYEAYTEADEADFVAREIQQHLESGEWQGGDVAIMYRTNAQSRALEEVFLQRALPYRLVGGTRFYTRREVKDLLAYLRLVHNLDDDVAFERVANVPARAIGQKSRTVLQTWATEQGLSLMTAAVDEAAPLTKRAKASLRAFHEMVETARAVAAEGTVEAVLDHLIREIAYQDYLFAEFDDAEDRWLNVMELRTVASNYDAIAPEAALSAFLEDVALVSDLDSLEDGARSAVTLITLHAAKGLEFPVAFLVGMEEGVLPHLRSFDHVDSMEEERRLCYVGMTRAQKRLYLVHAFRRALAGSSGHNPPSRYLDEIPEDAVDRRGRTISTPSPDIRPARNRRVTWDEFDGVDPDPAELPEALREGDAVRHATFGSGLVVACLATGTDHELTVDFEGVGVKKLLMSLAPLEKI